MAQRSTITGTYSPGCPSVRRHPGQELYRDEPHHRQGGHGAPWGRHSEGLGDHPGWHGDIAHKFTFELPPPPTITSFTPTKGPITGGTVVTIEGTNLIGATAVTFGTAAVATVTSDVATRLVVTTAASAAGTVAIKVTTVGGSTTSTGKFDYFVPAPSIATLTPATGTTTGTTSVTIHGTHLTGATVVKFGATTAKKYTIPTSHAILAVTKAHAAGTVKVSVTTPGGEATSPADFKFKTPSPTVTSFTPTSGRPQGHRW